MIERRSYIVVLLVLTALTALGSHIATAEEAPSEPPWQRPDSDGPVPILLDVAMDALIDDVGALAVLHALADRGEAEILGVMVSSGNPYSALCAERINTFYGRGDVPVGQIADATLSRASAYARGVAEAFPGALKKGQVPGAVDEYRRILAGQPGGSVVVVSTGYLTNMQQLLESGPDQHSELSGRELVASKVGAWVCTGGRFPAGEDGVYQYHLRVDPEASAHAVGTWPTPIVFSGEWYAGGHGSRVRALQRIQTGPELRDVPPPNPVRHAYTLFNALDYDSRDWTRAQPAVVYGVRGFEGRGDGEQEAWEAEWMDGEQDADTEAEPYPWRLAGGRMQSDLHAGEIRWVGGRMVVDAVTGKHGWINEVEGTHWYLAGYPEGFADELRSLMTQPPSRRVAITRPSTRQTITAEEPLTIEMDVESRDGSIKQVIVRTGDEAVGTMNEPPWEWTWEAPLQGTHRVTVEAAFEDGLVLTSVPVDVHVAPEARAGLPAVTDGLLAAYMIDERGGWTIHDRSGRGMAGDMWVGDAVRWLDDGRGVEFDHELASAKTELAPYRLTRRLRRAEAFTLEAWLEPLMMDQRGPAPIVSFSGDGHNVTLGHGCGEAGPDLCIQLRTTSTDADGMPPIRVEQGLVDGLSQYVITYAGDEVTVYRDGERIHRERRDGDLSGWREANVLVFGADDDPGGPRWRGRLVRVAIYDRALGPEEVRRNHTDGPKP